MGYVCSRSYSSNVNGCDIYDRYKIGGVLGSGSFGQVRDCVRKSSNETFAVKVMTKDAAKGIRERHNVNHGIMFRNEIAILSTLSHPNIIRLHESFEDKRYFYAILDRCDGGELFSHIVRRRRFPENETAQLCRQMLLAIAYVHSCGIVHRDIKAENFLFYDTTQNSRLILIDFGMSARIPQNNYLKQLCGSPHYVAPEIIRRNYRFQVDMWALGVTIFLMLFGKYPFEGSNQRAIIKAILNQRADYTTHRHCSISSLAVSFLDGLLEKNPDMRFTAQQALEHPWLDNTDKHEGSEGCANQT